MTSQLLILGNGFDLQCELKSKYKDFFRQEILDATLEANGKKQIKRGVTGFWEGLLFQYYRKFGDVDYKWCDVESIIKDTLLDLGLDDEDSRGISDVALQYIYNNRYLQLGVHDDPVSTYLLRYCYEFFYPLHRETNYSDQEKVHFLIERLLFELKNFENRFCKYIRKELNDTYIVNAVNLLAKITKFSSRNYGCINDIVDLRKKPVQKGGEVIYEKGLYKDFDRLGSRYILSFNYTALFDLLNIESPCKVYSNVHGKLCNEDCSDNCNSSKIIFGIDDKLIQSKVENSVLRVFSKTYRKMSQSNMPESVLPKNDEPVEIIFYGHSLSEADYSYFQSIFDYYNLYGNSGVCLCFYYSNGYDPSDAVYRLINEYGKTLDNKDQGKNLMHKLLLENRLKINPID